MGELLELSSYRQKLSELISYADMDDCVLPSKFKEAFTNFGEYKISNYNKYTLKVVSKKSSIVIPNQWVFIAGCCCQYHLELVKYKQKLISLGITDEIFEACHPSNDNKAIPEEGKTKDACRKKAEQSLSEYAGEDKQMLVDFLWNYDSWGGGKNIKRSNDFTESPVLNIANTINASSALIGSIAKGLANQPDVLSLLLNSEEWSDVYAPSQNKGNKSTNTQLHIKDDSIYRPYITAIKSKPFLLLAGISGTGKSRIVRELARACWEAGSEEYKAQQPRNFEMVQVKPNWHDSSELIGYVSRVSGKAEFVAGDFLKFVATAWEDPDTPYFLCLDEMNLAPVEQYFAEYLSVVESRKCGEDGVVATDPILKKEDAEWYFNLTATITSDDKVRTRFNEDGICIPQNLIVVGTVNMDETTFSFSRKVLDRAMTIEMNDVDLQGGLTERHECIGKLGNAELVGTAVEGVDVYSDYTDVCNTALGYLQKVNDVLEGTPFKIAYRTRNEFLLYVVNNLPYNKDKDGNDLPQGYVIARALDEITSMKILSRIEGDDTKVTDSLLNTLSQTITDGLNAITDEEHPVKSVSVAKLDEMKHRLQSGYTSFWS